MKNRLSADVGGGARGISTRTSHLHMQPVYHANTPAVESPAGRRREFEHFLVAMVEYLHAFAQDKEERTVCKEVKRLRSLSVHGLKVLVRLAARSDKPFILEETMRAAVLAEMVNPTLPCVFEASESEQASNEPLNLAQLLAHKEKTPIRWTQVAETGMPQYHATRVLIDVAWQQAWSKRRAFAGGLA